MGGMKDLLGDTPLDSIPHFDGKTYEPEKDHKRLGLQLTRVRTIMSDGDWHSLRHISVCLYYPESSVSARIRDLRKPKFGGHTIERRRVGGGLFEYRMKT